MTRAMKSFMKETRNDGVTDEIMTRMLRMLKAGIKPQTIWMMFHDEYPKETTRIAVMFIRHCIETGEIKRYLPRMN